MTHQKLATALVAASTAPLIVPVALTRVTAQARQAPSFQVDLAARAPQLGVGTVRQ
jgi:hypothetical protein